MQKKGQNQKSNSVWSISGNRNHSRTVSQDYRDARETVGNNPLAQRQGFTLFEMMIVLAIVSLMSVVSVTSFRGKQTQDAREQEIEALLGDIRAIQNRAMATDKCDRQPAGYFGVRWSIPGQYELYCAHSTGEVIESSVSLTGLSQGNVYFVPPAPERNPTGLAEGGNDYQNFITGSTVISISESGSIDIN